MSKAMNRFLLLIAVAACPPLAATQESVDSLTERELALTEAIRNEELENGPYSAALIEQFTSLSLLYEEAGDIGLADATIGEALQVIRANYGLNSLEQAPSIRRLIAHEEMRGNAAGAWDLSQQLLRYAFQHPDDLRAAEIYRETAEKRMDVLKRYDDGEFPPEIVLGCYYNEGSAYRQVFRRGSQPMAVAPIRQVQSCNSGSRQRARRSLLLEAHGLYSQAADVLRRNDDHPSADFREVVWEIIESSYRYGTPRPGRLNLTILLDYDSEYADDWLPRIETLIHLADWDLMYSSDFGTRMSDLALQNYRQALDSLRKHDASEELVESFFSPEIPVMLPAFGPNPLEFDEESESAEYIDAAFIITAVGKSDQIEILEWTTHVTRAARRDLVQMIKNGRFRPRIVDGEFPDATAVTVRYYLDN